MRCRLIAVAFVLMGAFPAAASAAGPSAIGVDGTGVAYVGYAGNGQIARYGADGTQLTSWGTPGNAPGDLALSPPIPHNQ